MTNVNYRVEPDRITIYPHWGTGWQTVLNHLKQEIVMRPCFLWFKLALRRQFPYSQIVGVATVCRETWWSGILTGIGGTEDAMAKPNLARSPMAFEGIVYDILVTVKGGKKPIRIGTLKSPDIASEIEREARQRLGLSET